MPAAEADATASPASGLIAEQRRRRVWLSGSLQFGWRWARCRRPRADSYMIGLTQ
jgi:hypothetical protein